MAARQTQSLPEPEVSSEFLAAQRRSIYRRMDEPRATGPFDALGSLARDAAADAGRRPHAGAPPQSRAAQSRTNSYSPISPPWSRATSPKPSSRSMDCSRNSRCDHACSALTLLFGGSLFAQMPKGIYAWWSRPQIARDLNLSPAQREQIRATVQQYRPHLLNVRVAVNQAEQALAEQFNRNPVDPGENQRSHRAVGGRAQRSDAYAHAVEPETAPGAHRTAVAGIAAPPARPGWHRRRRPKSPIRNSVPP